MNINMMHISRNVRIRARALSSHTSGSTALSTSIHHLISRTYKTKTGLIGINPDPNGKQTLQAICKDVLKKVKCLPVKSIYRNNTEEWFTIMQDICKSTDDIKEIEETIGQGQIEEVIEMGKDELTLIDRYIAEGGWESEKTNVHSINKSEEIERVASTLYTEDQIPVPDDIEEALKHAKLHTEEEHQPECQVDKEEVFRVIKKF